MESIKNDILCHFRRFLGSASLARSNVNYDILREGPTLNEDDFRSFDCNTSSEEIKAVMFSIKDEKAPGPDGYTSCFFKKSWRIVGENICSAVKEFFQNGKMLRQINATNIVLIPKKDIHIDVGDFRPIACCNVLYKVISKILSNRLANVISRIISQNQSALIPGRNIADNILHAHEIVRNYHRKNCNSVAIKVDVQKAYDSVSWDFIEEVLIGFNFPNKFVMLVMTCIRTPMYSIMINGESVGYFPGGRGLRQGDPISPLLFVLCMEYFTRILKRNTKPVSNFVFHKGCKDIIKESICLFSNSSGLKPNLSKSSVFFNGASEEKKRRVLNILGFQEGEFPVRYLGRLQLVNSVLWSMNVFWCSIFVLPKAAIAAVENICRNYLWHGANTVKRRGLVKWDYVCRRKDQGGLGIKSIHYWNVTAISKHVWGIVSHKPSIWANWVNVNRLKRLSFWVVTKLNDCSWNWKQLLNNRKNVNAEVPKNAKVLKLWRNNNWVLPDPIDEDTSNAWDYIKANFKIDNNREDVIEWKAGANGKFSIKSAFKHLCPDKAKVEWSSLIWSGGHIPRFSFVSWVAIRRRLLTKDKLKMWNVIQDDNCSLCRSNPETAQHLFFDCVISADIWKRVLDWLEIRRQPYCLRREVRWFVRRAKGRSIKANKRRLSFSAAVYAIWRSRNETTFNQRVIKPEQSFRDIKNAVEAKLLSSGCFRLRFANARPIPGQSFIFEERLTIACLHYWMNSPFRRKDWPFIILGFCSGLKMF
ncbi:uncharacterized protein LOC126657053 [Mercurialis annua]|uniref:uncharacterized protein LOC126657053 n=1 Tax=Mercurialis annua TaxID=3986 RepID=UPI0021602686|nr:uncharacterized protein LOC126657053 [Mercurialis annua]